MAEEPAPAAVGAKKSNPAVLIGGLVAAAAVGGGVFAFVSHKKAAGAEATAAAPVAAAAPESFYDLDEFLINLANPEGDRYLRVTLSLSFTHEIARDEIKAQLPKVRDIIIDVLASQTTHTLGTPEGRNGVKDVILKRLTAIVPSAGIDGVYFQLFTFQ